MKKSEFKSYLKEEIFEILSEETAQDIEAKTKAQAELNKELEKTKELMKENVSQEVINKVSRFVTSFANYYDYSEQDAVYAIIQALRAHGAGFQVNEEKTININTIQTGDEISYIIPGTSNKMSTGVVIDKGSTKYEDFLVVKDIKTKEKRNIFMSNLGNKINGAGFQVNEEEMDDEEMDKQASSAAQKGDSISKAASKLGEITREMKSVVNQYKKSEEPEKSKHLARLKELTKIKKELEALL
jgi:hypothetical protein